MRPSGGGDDALGHALPHELLSHFVIERSTYRGESRKSNLVEGYEHGLRSHRADRGKPDAIGRQHARERMDQDRCDAERVGDKAGVLAAGAAEGVEHIFGDVVAALHRDGLDCIRHVLDRDPDAALGHLLWRLAVPELPRERLESFAYGVAIEWLVVPRSKNAGKKI